MLNEDPAGNTLKRSLNGLWPVASHRANFQSERYGLLTDIGRLLMTLDLTGLVEHRRNKSAAIERLGRALRDKLRLCRLGRVVAMAFGCPGKRAEVGSGRPRRQLAEQQKGNSAQP